MPCSPERQPVPTAAKPGDRGRREPDLQRLAPQPRQHRRILRVGVEQFGAQPVDKQHARRGDIALKGDSGSEARHAHRCQHRRHHVGQVRDVRIGLRQFH